ncbi:ATP-binding protein [Niallia taxi]|uniref:histidine kinase n=1 Tax=Niallia taxi TaxID=2499688 RepID=A0A3S2TR55_9BACI|nr:ATP-binding protein [Niallia taxi]RVT57220.1 PAS domain S-box protein [Niallia taxi]
MRIAIEELNFQKLMDNSLNSTLVLDKRTIVYANSACIKLLSLNTKEDILNQNFDFFLHPDFHSICKDRLKRVVEYQEIAPLMEQKMIRLDGTIIDVEIMATPYQHERKIVSHVIIRDITEKKVIQKKIMQSEKLSLIGELASGIVHEIRNPLTSIKGFIQLLKIDFPKNIYADIVLSELEQIEQITNELLYLSKPKETIFESEDLIQIVEETVNLFGTQAFKNNIEILFDKRDCEGINVLGDRSQLKQVFLNLIKNAIESMAENGKIHISAEKDVKQVHISIKDSGIGIPRNQIKKIGQSFFTNKAEGTGLGLMVTYNIIESHNGKIEVDSEVGIGTVFTVKLPYVKRIL